MTTPTPSEKPSATKPKHRRWWKILLSLVLLLLLLILLAPTLLSTSLGKSLILNQVNSRMPGKINADSLSLGWFSGANVHKLEVIDAAGKNVLSLDLLDTPVTLCNVLAGSIIDLKQVAVTGGKLPQLPGTTVSVHLVGTADLGKKIINIAGDSTISAIEDKTSKGTILTLASGSKLSWADLPSDAHATLAYDLTQIQTLINASLPTGTILAGQRTKQFHITGALTKDPGLRALRGLSIDPTSIGIDRVTCKGLDLGKADIAFQMIAGILTFTPTDIPANGGTLTISGKIDFSANPPAYIIEQRPQGNPLVKNIALNHEIAANWLAAFPLVWGGMDKSANLATITGQLNIQLANAYIPLDSAAYKTKGTLAGSLNISNLTTDAPFLADAVKALGPVLKITQPDLLTIKGGSIPDVPFALANGKISYQNLRLGTDKANLTFSGSVGLDTSLAMNMELTANKLNVPIPIGLKGTTAKPELTITAAGLANPQHLGKTLEKAAPGLIDQFLNKKKK